MKCGLAGKFRSDVFLFSLILQSGQEIQAIGSGNNRAEESIHLEQYSSHLSHGLSISHPNGTAKDATDIQLVDKRDF